jgi:3-phosphoshikimate 1-carboxyvinyltransferase
VALDASASSQFLSALLLAGPRYERGIEVTETSGAMPSAPHAAMTAAALAEFGAAVEAAPPRWRAAGPLRGRDLAVEPDLSNAGPFLAAALVTGGRVRAPGWPRATTQAGDLLRQHLRAFGAEVSWADGTLSVEAGDGIVGVDLDLTAAGELAPALAALAVLADGPSRLRGIAHLRGHETDRLAALAAEIGRLGGRARQLPDGLEIEPGRLAGAVVETYGDHRMAAFAAIVGLAVPGVMASDIAATAKTMPDFPERWARLAAGA